MRAVVLSSILSCAFLVAVGCSGGTPELGKAESASDASAQEPTPSPPDGGKAGAPDEQAPRDAMSPPPPQFNALPFSGGKDAPVVASLTVQCSSAAVYVRVVVTDPNGIDDLAGLNDQSVGLYPNEDGSGVTETQMFYVSSTGSYFGGSTSGTYFGGLEGTSVRSEICAADQWPAKVVVRDKTGHVTTGAVLATRIE